MGRNDDTLSLSPRCLLLPPTPFPTLIIHLDRCLSGISLFLFLPPFSIYYSRYSFVFPLSSSFLCVAQHNPVPLLAFVTLLSLVIYTHTHNVAVNQDQYTSRSAEIDLDLVLPSRRLFLLSPFLISIFHRCPFLVCLCQYHFPIKGLQNETIVLTRIYSLMTVSCASPPS